MTTMMCKCDNELSNNDLPNLVEGIIRGIYEYDEKNVWSCSSCGRLAIEVSDVKGDVAILWYKPEENYNINLFTVSNSQTILEEIKKNIEKYTKKLKLFQQVIE